MRIVVAAILGLLIIPARADDELEFCAVVTSAPAGYIILHDGPGSKFGTRAKLAVDDLLYADRHRAGAASGTTARAPTATPMSTACIAWTALRATTRTAPPPAGSAPNTSRRCHVICDWGYRDPAWPTLEALDADPPPSGLNVLTRE